MFLIPSQLRFPKRKLIRILRVYILPFIFFTLGALVTYFSDYALQRILSINNVIKGHIGVVLISLLLFLILLLGVHYLWRRKSAGQRSSEMKVRSLVALGEILLWSPVLEGTFKLRGELQTDKVVELKAFYMSIYLVTNKQYKMFIDEKGYAPPSYWDDEQETYPKGRDDHPVVNVSREDAENYCNWLSELTGIRHRLPDEWEWEGVARGFNGLEYPWGNTFDRRKCNCAESKIYNTTPVGTYKDGRSPFGCYDMVGNVSEWTKSEEAGYAVIRGSSYENEASTSNCYFRITLDSQYIADFIGFRIVKEDN